LVGGGDHGAELLVDKIALGTEFLVEFIPTRKAQNMGDASPTELVFGQILALPIIVTLNGMFDVAQEAVGFRQLPIDARWQAVELLQARQNLEQAALLQLSVAAAANDLKRLGDKFHFANAAEA